MTYLLDYISTENRLSLRFCSSHYEMQAVLIAIYEKVVLAPLQRTYFPAY